MTDLFVPGILMLLIGIVLMIIYIITNLLTRKMKSAGLLLTIPGAVLLVLGLFAVAAPDLFFSMTNLIATACVAFLACGYVYMTLMPSQPPTTTVGGSLKGKKGIVTHDINPDSKTDGKVKIDSTIWSATADIPIKTGTKVQVVESEGVHIIVEPLGYNQPKE